MRACSEDTSFRLDRNADSWIKCGPTTLSKNSDTCASRGGEKFLYRSNFRYVVERRSNSSVHSFPPRARHGSVEQKCISLMEQDG